MKRIRFILAALLAAGSVQAADLVYNVAATTNLTGDVSYNSVKVGNLSASASTIVDATGTTGFTANGTQFFVGAGPSGFSTMTGTLKLGPLNTITANQITIGGLEPGSNGNAGHAGLVTTVADSVTTINAANMALGTGKGNGTQISGVKGGKFLLGSGATLNLYGLSGSSSRAALVLGRLVYDSEARGTGFMDLSAGTANLLLSELALGKVSIGNALGDTTEGTLTLGTSGLNHLDISGAGSVMKIGYNSNNNNTVTRGTLTIGNLDSTSSVTSTDNSTAILIGYRSASSGTIEGTLNLNGGTLKITTTGSAIAGSGGTKRALNLKDCTLIAGASSENWITGLTAATLTNTVTFDTDINAITVPQAFSGSGSLKKTGAGLLALTGSNIFSGALIVADGTLAGERGSTGGGALTNQATLSPGGTATANFLHTGPVVLESGSTLRMDVGASTNDSLTVTGAVALDGALTLVKGADLLLTSYTLIAGTSVSGTFSATKGLPEGCSLEVTATSVVLHYLPPVVPETPTGLSATAGDMQVSLSWSSTLYAEGYNLWRATVESGPYTAVLTNYSGTSYVDTGLVNLTTYYYKVSATNAFGESTLSSPVSATPTSPKDILTFVFPGLPATTIGSNTVTVTVPYGTDVTALSPTYTLSPNATCIPVSGPVPGLDFSTPQTYTVTGEDTSTKVYTVTVNITPPTTGKDILTFVFPGLPATTIDTNAATVIVTVPYGTDVSALSPTYTLSTNATCNPVSGPVPGLDFSTPQTYTVTAQDSSTKVYTVTVNITPPSVQKDILTFAITGATSVGIDTNAATVTVTMPFWVSVTALVPTYTLSQYATCNPVSNPSPGLDFTTPRLYRVTAQDGSTKDFTVTVNTEASPGEITPVYTNLADGTIVATFTNGAGTWTVPRHVSSVRVLVVGGGGSGRSGGAWFGPGGGPGGLWHTNAFTVTPSAPINVVVGEGGASAVPINTNGQAGKPSVFGSIVAYGGQGGTYYPAPNMKGSAQGDSTDGVTVKYGKLGGTTTEQNAVGSAGDSTNGLNGYWGGRAGGNGSAFDITGSSVYYAGGGGWGYNQSPGGLGGGGAGGPQGQPGVAGKPNTGGGGGGTYDAGNSGAGGSGVVIVSYDPPPAGTMVIFY